MKYSQFAYKGLKEQKLSMMIFFYGEKKRAMIEHSEMFLRESPRERC